MLVLCWFSPNFICFKSWEVQKLTDVKDVLGTTNRDNFEKRERILDGLVCEMSERV